MTAAPAIRTLGDLRTHQKKNAGSYAAAGIKAELRRNLTASMRAGEPLFPGIVGYDRTVLPQVINAILAGHDILLLGLRGQAKTRLARTMVRFLDEWTPVLVGSSLNEHPLAPVTPQARAIIEEQGDDVAIRWMHREERFHEKLATPDVSVADLIGDIDPIRAANEGLALDDLRSVSFGLIPRSNRGIFCINELPDLPPRIQVALFNILEEHDVQVRGIPLRLPLDTFLVLTANPEDYTNRGTIITPLKDRIAAQILTHYPHERDHGVAIMRQEALIERDGPVQPHCPDLFLHLVEEVARAARTSEYVDVSSGVSARMTVAGLESLVANAERRGLIGEEGAPRVRMLDLPALVPAMTGKVELAFDGEQRGPVAVAEQLIGSAVRTLWDEHLPAVLDADERPIDQPDSPFAPILRWFAAGESLTLTDRSADAEYAAALEQVDGLMAAVDKLVAPPPAERVLWADFILEGLFWHGVLAREGADGVFRYTDLLASMMSR